MFEINKTSTKYPEEEKKKKNTEYYGRREYEHKRNSCSAFLWAWLILGVMGSDPVLFVFLSFIYVLNFLF